MKGLSDRIKQYQQQEISKQKGTSHDEVQLIASRYNSLKQQCEERIGQARTYYQECFRIWQQEQNWMKDKR